MQQKFNYYTSIGKFIAKLPVIVISILIGLPLAFIRSCVMGTIEVSDTIMDMVFDIEQIDAENEHKHRDFQHNVMETSYEQEGVDK